MVLDLVFINESRNIFQQIPNYSIVFQSLEYIIGRKLIEYTKTLFKFFQFFPSFSKFFQGKRIEKF